MREQERREYVNFINSEVWKGEIKGQLLSRSNDPAHRITRLVRSELILELQESRNDGVLGVRSTDNLDEGNGGVGMEGERAFAGSRSTSTRS